MCIRRSVFVLLVFFFNDTSTTEIYTYCHTLSLHDALPILTMRAVGSRAEIRRSVDVAHSQPGKVGQDLLGIPEGEVLMELQAICRGGYRAGTRPLDRKSTRLNSSH